MKTQWEIPILFEETERIAITFGDPADALIAAENYALKPLPDAILNWHSIAPLLKLDHWYDTTAFYSRRKADLSAENAKLLFEYNQRAFDAAKAKGGLVLYFQGVLIGNDIYTNLDLELPFVPNCLSFCIWESLQIAKKGAKIPEHKEAAKMVSLWYERFSLVKYQVKLEKTPKGNSLVFQKIDYK
jgi:hypothetical protein